MNPVIHHVELCVFDTESTLRKIKKYGFRAFAKRENAFCKQVAVKLNNIIFIVTEKASGTRQSNQTSNRTRKSIRSEPLTILCSQCEDETICNDEHVDTVFNVALNVKSVKSATERIQTQHPNSIIQSPTIIQDHLGDVSYAIIKSACGNVVHTLLNKDKYKGKFLPGFKLLDHVDDIEECSDICALNKNVTHIDHVTLACHTGTSHKMIQFYQSCFGMEKFNISRNDEEDGLILKEGVGLRLQAMQYWRCSEQGLISPNSKDGERMMLVLVESLPGQTNCNVETFLKEHKCPGVEHIAFSCKSIVNTVSQMTHIGVQFRLPPMCYYNELRQMPHIKEIDDVNMDEVAKLGILLDRERDPDDPGEDGEQSKSKYKYLMQIFSLPMFDRKTFFVEFIQRHGARGLGQGNIVALVRSIREDEKRKAAEADKNRNTKELKVHRQIC